MEILIRSACNEIKITRNNPNQNYFLIYEVWEQCREYIPRHEFEKALADLARSGTLQLLGGDPSILTGQQIKDCYTDHKNRLRINLRWVKNPADTTIPEQVKARLAYLEMENQRLQDEITRLKSRFHQQQESESADPPKNFQGWTVSKNNRGYWQMFKRIDGTMQSIHIGKAWNEDKALKKIEKSLERTL